MERLVLHRTRKIILISTIINDYSFKHYLILKTTIMYSFSNLKYLLILIVTAISFTSCTKSNSSGSSNIDAGQTKSIIQNGTWRVTYFFDKTDETNKFSGYNFSFNSSGNVTATKGGSTVNGTWSSGNDDSQVKLVLNFNGVNPFDDIEDDWHIISQSNSEIKLNDISGGSGETDYLTFEKN